MVAWGGKASLCLCLRVAYSLHLLAFCLLLGQPLLDLGPSQGIPDHPFLRSLTSLHLQMPLFQIRPRAQVPGVRMCFYLFDGHSDPLWELCSFACLKKYNFTVKMQTKPCLLTEYRKMLGSILYWSYFLQLAPAHWTPDILSFCSLWNTPRRVFSCSHCLGFSSPDATGYSLRFIWVSAQCYLIRGALSKISLLYHSSSQCCFIFLLSI